LREAVQTTKSGGIAADSASRQVLAELVSPASFMLPEYCPPSAWLGHAPFLFWLFDTLRPKLYVELGTHYGYSYFCACQAAASLNIGTRCIAVDTWKGDEHVGRYGDSIFQSVDRHNRKKYADFSKLLRSTFEEALTYVEDESVDLLHVDGRHRYEDVRQDFEFWIPKLAEGAIVLFHDVIEKRGDFGVHRYWGELVQKYPAFHFEHDHGLGVISVGPVRSPTLERFFETASSPVCTAFLRQIYERLGISLPTNRLSVALDLAQNRLDTIPWRRLLNKALARLKNP
jgi:hypothetical protein